jgi:hypothetical protein
MTHESYHPVLLALAVGTIVYVTVFGAHWPWPP